MNLLKIFNEQQEGETFMIYGVSILALCMFLGKYLGELLGELVGIGADVGGVGFAMLLLLIVTNSKLFQKYADKKVSVGIEFWKEMYIPVVIAMAASQNVYQALSSGIYAIIAGLAAVALAFALLPVINRLFKEKENS